MTVSIVRPLRMTLMRTTWAPSGAKTTARSPCLRTVRSFARVDSVRASSLSFGAVGAGATTGGGARAAGPCVPRGRGGARPAVRAAAAGGALVDRVVEARDGADVARGVDGDRLDRARGVDADRVGELPAVGRRVAAVGRVVDRALAGAQADRLRRAVGAGRDRGRRGRRGHG